MPVKKTPPPDRFPVTEKPMEATLRIGPHMVAVPREVFEKWESDIAAEVGFSRQAITAEIKRRLGLD